MMMINDTAETIYADFIAAKKKKEIYANLILMQSSSFGKYMNSDALLNLNILPGIDANDEWFDKTITDAYTFGNKIYALSGYATDPVEACGCLYVNLDKLAGKGITLNYGDVKDGSFTVETFLTWAKALGRESVSLNEPYSYQSAYLMISQGGNFIDYGGGDHSLSSFNDEEETVVNYIKDVLGYGRKTTDPTGETVYDGIDRFQNGETSFMFGSLGAVWELDACAFRWEILPLPAAESGEYITPVCGNAPIIAATTSDGNIDAMAYILNAVNITSKDFIRAEYINDLVKNRMRTTHTADMVDIILDAKRVLDPAISLSEGYANIKKGTIGALTGAVDGTKSFASLLSSTRSKASSTLKGIK
ncbi:MAG: extracellular solute-binding protein, partial [Firmicutes bacterium]|nr:extracellular solute-binding protein [Candidatus Colimorpha enterica]